MFEAVCVENLESIDIQNTDCVADLPSCRHGCIDSFYDPVKEFIVNGFSESVSNGSCLGDIERDIIDRPSTSASLSLNDTRRQCLVDGGSVYVHEVGNVGGDTVVGDTCVSVLVLCELNVSQPENGSKDSEYIVYFLLGEADGGHGLEGISEVDVVIYAVCVVTL